jgi:spore germination protein (amino acid permease)
MLQEGRFGLFGAVCLTSIMITSKIFYTNIGQLVNVTGTAAWQSSLISASTAMFFFTFMYLLLKRFPDKNLFEITDLVMGRFIGVCFGIIYTLYLIFYAGTNLREFIEMIKAYNLPYTPTSILIVCVLSVVLIISYYGLECLTKISIIFFIPIMLGLIIIFALAWSEYDYTLLRPYFGYGMMNTLRLGFLRSSGYSEIVRLTIIIASLQNIKNFKRAGYISIVISGAVFVFGTIFYVMTFGYFQGSEDIAGIFELTRGIYFNRFFQRIESLFLFMWVIAAVISIAGAFYISISCFCKTFKINNHKPLLLPFAMLVFIVTMQPKNLAEVLEINIKVTRQYSLFIFYLGPVLILLISIIRGKKGEKCNESNK